MNAGLWLVAGMCALVVAVAAWGLILDRRDNLERDRLAAADAAKRAERERERAVEAASLPAQAREPGRVILTLREKRLFREIAEHSGMDVCVCGHSGKVHEHHRAGSDCSQCGCGRYRRRAPDAARGRKA